MSPVAGTAYLMGRSTASALYNASLDTPLFHLEDIFVTGILASKVHIRWPRSVQLRSSMLLVCNIQRSCLNKLLPPAIVPFSMWSGHNFLNKSAS